jgi:hypothetical protein
MTSTMGKWVQKVSESFQWFNPKVGTPIVSVADYGITFNKAASEEMRNPKRIQLGFNAKTKQIGVKALHEVNDETENVSFAFANRERNGYIRINSRDFIRFISRHLPELRFDKAVRCLAWWDDEQNVLIVDLNNPIDGQADADETRDDE